MSGAYVRAALAAAIVLFVALPSAAQEGEGRRRDREFLERVSPDIELIALRNLDRLGQDAFSFGAGGGVHVEFNLLVSLGIHGGASLFVLAPGNSAESSVFWFGSELGVRWHWTALVDAVPGDGWVDAHHVYGRSGDIIAHGANWGLGYQFTIHHLLGLGPYVRMFWFADPGLSDPILLVAGAELAFLPEIRLGFDVPDDDLDGIADYDDLCPQEAVGRYTDPERPGCPARDRDGDGLVDPADECPSETMWPFPDRDHEGCPLADRDRDGVPDRFDLCPETFAADGGDPLREGCPEGEAGF